MLMVIAAGNLSLAYIGGLVLSFLSLLAYFGGLTKYICQSFWVERRLFLGSLGQTSAYLVGLAASGLPARSFLPF